LKSFEKTDNYLQKHSNNVQLWGEVVKLTYILFAFCAVLIIIVVFQYKTSINTKYMLDRKNEINDRMMVISEELNNFKDIDDLYKKLLKETINIVQGAETGSILIYNKEKDYMDYKATYGFDEEALKKVHLKKEELFLYDSTKLMTPDIIKNPLLFNKEKLEKQIFDDLLNSNSLSIKACICAPLHINGEFYGVINLDNKTNEDAFNKNDLKLTTYICRQLEIAIKNVSLMNELSEALKTDKLTNLYNRRYFEDIIGNSFLYGDFNRKTFSVVMIDLDDFKLINDTYGHKVGDEVLVYFAKAMKSIVRNEDLVVRYAGDEFVLFLNNTDEKGALFVLDRIRESLKKYPKEDIKIKFSAGICEYNENMNLDKILTIADGKMYKEKRKNKA
jgi:diguanylate cyclase (GGDEF)-like protein